ncbi:hypothetical protein BC835DRAFT_1331880 [Cytidiella melzeri]|nr:hypothetical protein BC835DRAFT_1331880 [Cytidiella melzeri]
MRFSTPLVLFVAILIGELHTVTVSAVPYPHSSGNLEGHSTSNNTVPPSSVLTTVSELHYKRSK